MGVSDPNRLGASDLLASRDMKSLKDVHPSPMAFKGACNWQDHIDLPADIYGLTISVAA